MSSFPSGVKSFTTKLSGDTVQASHVNDIQSEVTAIETALVGGTLPAANGSALTALSASNLATGTVAVARLGSGTPSVSTFLRGDGAWAAELGSTEYNAGNTATAITLNFATNGPLQKCTRTGSCTVTLAAPTYPGTVVVKFIHEASATAYTVTFSPTVKFPGGVAPTWTNTSGAIDLVSLYWDGAAWFGVQTAAYA